MSRTVLGSSVSRGVLTLALLTAFIPATIKLLYYPNNIGSDDAYIHLRIATNFVRGAGWGINAHQPVNLSTAPAFTLLLSAAERLSSHAVGVVQVISAAAVVIGLLALFVAVVAETGSVLGGLFAEMLAALSNNLWRWNGTLMEATFAFAIVAITLYLLRRGKTQSLLNALTLGILLGVGVLMRPEMGMLCVLSGVVLTIRSEQTKRLQGLLTMVLGTCTVLALWFLFAHRNGISVLPTTFAAKSVHGVILLNFRILKQFAETSAESFLLCGIFVVVLTLLSLRAHQWVNSDRVSYVLPLGWVLGIASFYYLKTPGLESAGRYLLPLLPAEALLLALIWKAARGDIGWRRTATVSILIASAVFSLVVNQLLISPVLSRFENEYAASMRAAATELAKRTSTAGNKRVLVLVDIGVLSCAGNGRFEIFDGGALATPSLRKLDVTEQIDRVKPSFVVQSLATSPGGLGETSPNILQRVWGRRFFRHSIGVSQPYYYVIVFANKQQSLDSGNY